MFGLGGWRSKKNIAKGAFDPDDARRVRHTKLGAWDLYQEINPQIQHIPGSSWIEQYAETINTLPYAWKMFKDLGSLKDCRFRLALLLVLQVTNAVIPALSLWFSGQLLVIVEEVIGTRTLNTQLLQIAAGHTVCTILAGLLSRANNRVRKPLNRIVSNFYSMHLFRAYARLDYATFEDPIVMQQLNDAGGGPYSVAWEAVESVIMMVANVVRLGSQLGVLVRIMYGTSDGFIICALGVVPEVLESFNTPWLLSGVWAATCRNNDFIRSMGMDRIVKLRDYRQEVVAGGLGDHLIQEYETARARAGPEASTWFKTYIEERRRDRLSLQSLFFSIIPELPLVVLALRAPLYPASIPISFTSLQLVRQTVSRFRMDIMVFIQYFGSITEHLDQLRNLYQVIDIPNKIADGRLPFPEDQQKHSRGVSLEFRNVSFKYPGGKDYALHNISFKISKGQLCVIVGKNGSGKSTILKLITRLYDPSEGEILIDGYNLKSLKLADLRRAIAVLFQDYSYFPLSVQENIGLGDPNSAHDQEKIEAAAKLGGAYEFVEKLPEGFKTYLERPVQDAYGSLPEGTKTLFGRDVSYHQVSGSGFVPTSKSHLSGGQMQRLAVSRTFMRTLRSEEEVGMLLFDEPSASLDPTAEHELFERLRNLRGDKTMIFSSHRFGNLTRHADVIIYMDDSALKEIGTHKQLLEKKGEYARIYNLQAQAFL